MKNEADPSKIVMRKFISQAFLLSCLPILSSCFHLLPPLSKRKDSSRTRIFVSSSQPTDKTLDGLKVAVVGGGPSGLLLTHRLLKGGASHVSLFESRPRPGGKLESRAYALGIGIRGRTAIKSVDLDLWEAVKQAGYLSERFQFHVGPFTINLRSEKDGENIPLYEPSLLSYQSELCRVLADELDERWPNSQLSMKFDCKVMDVDLKSSTITLADTDKPESFDLIVGCDGVKSIVRKSIQEEWPDFEATSDILPGEFKVVRLPKMPPALDPTAVALLLPKAGSCTAFVEPTAGGQACVLFAGSNSTDTLFTSKNATELKLTIEDRFPKLVGSNLDEAVEQLISASETSKASVVKCNIYHYGNMAALVGDAAHATGGVSGQGVNSALVDAAVLADCLLENYDSSAKLQSTRKALLEYSKKQVPEGKALYELSFGPKPSSLGKRIVTSLANVLDFLFKGKFGLGRQPLQTLLTTSLQSFADIRRELDGRFDECFPTDSDWEGRVKQLDAKASVSLEKTKQ